MSHWIEEARNLLRPRLYSWRGRARNLGAMRSPEAVARGEAIKGCAEALAHDLARLEAFASGQSQPTPPNPRPSDANALIQELWASPEAILLCHRAARMIERLTAPSQPVPAGNMPVPRQRLEALLDLCRALPMPWTIERHGEGWAIYCGRDDQHHGLRLANLEDGDQHLKTLIAMLAEASTVLPLLLEWLAGDPLPSRSKIASNG